MAAKTVKQLSVGGTGQSLSDRASAVMFTISGSNVEKIIYKATTEEYIPPKRKHLSYLVRCTSSPQINILDLVNSLFKRLKHSNNLVVFKAYLVIHQLMQDGDERFLRSIATNNFNLTENSPSQDNILALFIRPYVTYLEVKALSYRKLAVDVCRVKLGEDKRSMRTMPVQRLLETLPVMEDQLDALLAFDARRNELADDLIKFAHCLMYRDLIRLYGIFNDAMINLIEQYFDLPKRDCKLALDAYRSFFRRMDSINKFLKLVELSDRDPLSVKISMFHSVPTSVLEMMEDHLAYLETSGVPQHDKPVPRQKAEETVAAATGNSTSGRPEAPASSTSSRHLLLQQIPEGEQKRIIEEERRRLMEFVVKANRRQQQEDQRDSLSSSTPTSDLLADLLAPDDDNDPVPAGHDLFLALSTSTAAVGVSNNFVTQQHQQSPPHNVLATVSAGPSGSVWPTQQQLQHLSNNPFLALSSVPHSPPASAAHFPGLVPSTNPFAPTFGIPETSYATTSAAVQANYPGGSGSGIPGKQQHHQHQLALSTNNGDSSTNGGVASLDDRLAQLVDSLAINSGSCSQSNDSLPFRGPDGSRTAVNWIGGPPVQVSRDPAPAPPTMRQLTAGQTFPFVQQQHAGWAGFNGSSGSQSAFGRMTQLALPAGGVAFPGATVEPHQTASAWPVAPNKPIQPVNCAAFDSGTTNSFQQSSQMAFGFSAPAPALSAFGQSRSSQNNNPFI